MTWAHGLGAALLFLGSTAAGFALRRELQQRAQLLAAVIDSLQLLRSDIVGGCCRCRKPCATRRRRRRSRCVRSILPSQTALRTATGRFASNGRRRSGHWTCSHRTRARHC